MAVALFVAAPALAGPEWVELGDAGSRYPTAQRTFGEGPLTSVEGSLDGLSDAFGGIGEGDFEDMYLITIVDPSIFSITVSAAFDIQIFLFNVTQPGEAFGLLGNSAGDPPFMGNMANDGSGAQVNLPGVYAIAVSGLGRDPVSINGLIYNFQNPGEVSGPDGPGGINPHTGWTGEGLTGDYTLFLTGVGFYDIPEPGALTLLAIAGGIAVRRRRR